MITGSYIIEVPRIEKILKKKKFLAKIYSPQEMKFLMEKHFPVFNIAEMFCAKCAFMKAMGISSFFYNFNLIGISFLSVKGTDTF